MLVSPVLTTSTAFGAFSVYRGVPAELTSGNAESFLQHLDGPTAFVLDGGLEKTRLVSCLVHGNEPSGLKAVARAFKGNPYSHHANMIYFVGNVRAAKAGLQPFSHRLLDNMGLSGPARDMNRIWAGHVPGGAQALVDSLLGVVHQFSMEACLDLHNTSGANPHFAVTLPDCIGSELIAGQLAPRVMKLSLESGLIGAMNMYCPSLVLECGKMGMKSADQIALRSLTHFLNDSLSLESRDITRYQVSAEVYIKKGLTMDFLGDTLEENHLSLSPQLEDLNFSALGQAVRIGRIDGDGSNGLPFVLSDHQAARQYFDWDDYGYIWLRPGYTLAMATLHQDNIRNSCLFYVLESQEANFGVPWSAA